MELVQQLKNKKKNQKRKNQKNKLQVKVLKQITTVKILNNNKKRINY
jgi:hypothetical protein